MVSAVKRKGGGVLAMRPDRQSWKSDSGKHRETRRFAAGLALVAFLLLAAATVAFFRPAQARAAMQSPGALPPAEITRINAVFRSFERPGSPGCALGVVRDNRLVYAHGYGLASVELNVPITPQTVFDLGSVSKQFTAASIFLLQQQGRLSIDDDIHTYLPELPSYGHRVTIRQLLHHTSGIRDYIDLLMMAGVREEDVTTDADALAIIARQKELNFTPGAEFLYSNSGYFLLSQIVKQVAGEPLREFAATHIFRPLHMTHTQILDNHTRIIPHRALSYAPRKGGGFQLDMSNWEQTGDGAVQTTVGDLALWDRNFYDPVVGGKQLIEELQTTGVLNDGEKIPYAAGLVVDRYRGLLRVEHTGSWAGFRADLVRFPDERVSVITLCNLANANPSAKGRAVADVVLEGKLGPAPKPAAGPEPGEAALQRFAGLYWSKESQQVFRIERQGRKLTIRANDSRKAMELAPESEGVFTAAHGRLRLRFVAGGKHGLLGVREGTGREEKFRRLAVARPTAVQLRSLAGRYHSPALQVTWSVSVRAGNLLLRQSPSDPNLRPDAPEEELHPALAGVFTGAGLVLNFHRSGGSITGFTASSSGTRRIRFDRVR
jgi:CubicO group peptidase (beta-lactamase class C family)